MLHVSLADQPLSDHTEPDRINMSALFAGVLAGSLHVVSGPDHLVAVTPLAVRSPARAMAVGAWWGAGHAVGAGLLGGLGAVARAFVDVEALSAWAEFLVGGVLCGVGIWAFVQARKLVVHRHGHDHPQPGDDTDDHAHLHAHLGAREHGPAAHAGHHHRTSFGVGVLHGAAGTGHLLAVLPSLALPPASAILYLAAYGLSAVLAMTLFSGAVGLVGTRLPAKVWTGVLYLSGAAAVALGVFWMISGYPAG